MDGTKLGAEMTECWACSKWGIRGTEAVGKVEVMACSHDDEPETVDLCRACIEDPSWQREAMLAKRKRIRENPQAAAGETPWQPISEHDGGSGNVLVLYADMGVIKVRVAHFTPRDVSIAMQGDEELAGWWSYNNSVGAMLITKPLYFMPLPDVPDDVKKLAWSDY